MNSKTMKYCYTRQRKRNFTHGDTMRELLRRGNSLGVADVRRSQESDETGDTSRLPTPPVEHGIPGTKIPVY